MYLYIPLGISRIFYILAKDSSNGELGSFVVAIVLAAAIQGILLYISSQSTIHHDKIFSLITSTYLIFFAAHTAVISARLACSVYYNTGGTTIYILLILISAWCCVYFSTNTVLRACVMLFTGIATTITGLLIGSVQQAITLPAIIQWKISLGGTISSLIELLSFSTELVLIGELVKHTKKPTAKGIAIFSATSAVVQLIIVLLITYTLGNYAGFSDNPALTMTRVLSGIGNSDAEGIYLAAWLLTGTLRTALLLSLAQSATTRIGRSIYIVTFPLSIFLSIWITLVDSSLISGASTVLTLLAGIAIPIVGIMLNRESKNS